MIDLRQQGKYRVAFEESYHKAGLADKADPNFFVYCQTISGKYGEIYWHSDSRLAV